MIYSTTMLPATNDPAEISKCFLDLLKKLNDVSSSIPTISANGPSIYASGSNSNGSYIQFADGTMELWGTVVPMVGGNVTTNIPYPVVPVGVTGTGVGIGLGYAQFPAISNTSSAEVFINNGSLYYNATSANYLYWIMKCRWK